MDQQLLQLEEQCRIGLYIHQGERPGQTNDDSIANEGYRSVDTLLKMVSALFLDLSQQIQADLHSTPAPCSYVACPGHPSRYPELVCERPAGRLRWDP